MRELSKKVKQKRRRKRSKGGAGEGIRTLDILLGRHQRKLN